MVCLANVSDNFGAGLKKKGVQRLTQVSSRAIEGVRNHFNCQSVQCRQH